VKIVPDCIVCMLRMALGIARLTLEEEDVQDFLGRVLEVEALRGGNWQVTAPEVGKDIWMVLVSMAGREDPLRAVKDRQNRLAQDIYPSAQELVQRSEDPFCAAVKCAIAGNALDVMVEADAAPTDGFLKTLESSKIDLESVRVLEDRVRRATRMVYFTDNCGEIVFDRLLLETIKRASELEVTAVTRSMPVLNDATVEDARAVGLDGVVPVIGNGISVPLPGTMLSWTSPEVRGLVEKADLVIAKGGANYECLSEDESLVGRISFLFQGKCPPLCRAAEVELGSLVVLNK
jgi:uncharacterized protein with ATP-grasp and redox domains